MHMVHPVSLKGSTLVASSFTASDFWALTGTAFQRKIPLSFPRSAYGSADTGRQSLPRAYDPTCAPLRFKALVAGVGIEAARFKTPPTTQTPLNLSHGSVPLTYMQEQIQYNPAMLRAYRNLHTEHHGQRQPLWETGMWEFKLQARRIHFE
ncbi:hypothetical protein C8Q79DRAFT_925382 [Trametes meyenii]|nr:hypothetical protein C8Q79DRAFT_925382 [Trametes meyenii]